jgi:hypothetical protein
MVRVLNMATFDARNKFDRNLEIAAFDRKMKDAIIEVADTMYLAQKWFESYEVPYQASDLTKVAELTLYAREWKDDE